MSIAWVLYVLLVGALFALGARAIASAVGLAGRSTRWVWAAALIGIAVLAIVAPRERAYEIAAIPGVDARAGAVAPIAAASRGSAAVALLAAAAATLALPARRNPSSANARIPEALAGPAALA